jgi:hypothetical protein
MSSWYIFSSLGFFPNAGQDIYYLVGPLYTKSSISLGNNKTISIEAQNASSLNLYIQSCTINGVEWTKSWFSHSDIKDGATIKFVMGPNPSNWAKADESLKYQGGTAVNNLKQESNEIIYPNPATSMVTILMPGKQYHELAVYGSDGKLTYKKKIAPDSSLMTLDVKNWNKGIYFIRLRNDTGSRNSKLIIE